MNLEGRYEERLAEKRSALEDDFIEQTLEIETGQNETYEQYLSSDSWKEKRDRVLQRDQYLCQGCLNARAVEVHHLHYDDVPNELMFDLVSVCRKCHERIHRRKLARLQRLQETQAQNGS